MQPQGFGRGGGRRRHTEFPFCIFAPLPHWGWEEAGSLRGWCSSQHSPKVRKALPVQEQAGNPQDNMSLTSLLHPNPQAQTRAEGESSTGTVQFSPIFFPLSSPHKARWGIPLLVEHQDSPSSFSHLSSAGRVGGEQALMRDPLPKSTLTSPKRCSRELWFVST